MTRPETRKEVSAWLGISFGTLRSWDSRFSNWLESAPGKKGSAVKKRYTENDLIVLLAIKNLRSQNKNFDQIEASLDTEITTTHLPEWGESVTASPTSELALTNRQLTTQLIEVSNNLAAAEARSEAIESERDRLLEELKETRSEATEAAERAAAAEVELRILKELAEASQSEKLTFWQRIFGR